MGAVLRGTAVGTAPRHAGRPIELHRLRIAEGDGPPRPRPVVTSQLCSPSSSAVSVSPSGHAPLAPGSHGALCRISVLVWGRGIARGPALSGVGRASPRSQKCSPSVLDSTSKDAGCLDGRCGGCPYCVAPTAWRRRSSSDRLARHPMQTFNLSHLRTRRSCAFRLNLVQKSATASGQGGKQLVVQRRTTEPPQETQGIFASGDGAKTTTDRCDVRNICTVLFYLNLARSWKSSIPRWHPRTRACRRR